jgi:hypothetical protein
MCLNVMHNQIRVSPIPLVARSKARFSGISFDGVTGSNPAGGHGCLCVVSDVCCLVEGMITRPEES